MPSYTADVYVVPDQRAAPGELPRALGTRTLAAPDVEEARRRLLDALELEGLSVVAVNVLDADRLHAVCRAEAPRAAAPEGWVYPGRALDLTPRSD